MRISDWSSDVYSADLHRLGCAVRGRPHPVCVPDLSSGREHTMEHTADGSLPQTLSPTDSERQWAALAHLSALVLALMTSWIAGAAGVRAAVVVYMIKDRKRVV